MKHRYYKRVLSVRATRCWGLIVVLLLMLPDTGQPRAIAGQRVPATPAPPPATAQQKPDRAASAPVQAKASTDTTPPLMTMTPPLGRTPLPTPARPLTLTAPKLVPRPAYDLAWTKPLTMDGGLQLAMAGPNLILGSEVEPLSAVSLATGNAAWKTAVPASMPLVLGDALVLSFSGGVVHALGEATGDVRWTIPLAQEAWRPLLGSGRVVIVSGTELLAYRSTDGSLLWRQELGAHAVAAPANAIDSVVVALADHTLVLLDLETGALRWRVPIGLTPVGMAGAADRVYYSSVEGLLCAHKHDTGQQDWCFRVRVPPIGAPVIGGHEIALTSLDNSLRLFDRRSGTLRRTVQLDVRAATGPLLSGDRWLLPLVTSEVLIVPRDSTQPTARAFELKQQPGPPLEASALAPDGNAVALISVSPAGRSLSVYIKHPVTAAPAPPAGSGPAASSAGTSTSGTSPAPNNAPATTPKRE